MSRWRRILSALPIPALSGLVYLIVGGLVYLQAARETQASVRNLLVFIASGIFALYLISLLFGAFNLRGLTVRRILPSYARASVPCNLTLALKRRGRLGMAFLVRVREEEQAGLIVREPWAALTSLPNGEERRAQLRILFPRRGSFTLSAISVSSAFPFGLIRFSRRFEIETRVCVYPRALALPSWLGERLVRSAYRFGESLQSQQGEDEVYGVREYRIGDNPRRIHWPTTARIGTPMLLEMEGREEMVFRVILDTYGEGESQRAELEKLISLAAGVVEELHGQGMALGLSYYADRYVTISEDRSESSYHACMEVLADAGYSQTPLTDWSERALSDAAKGSRLVVLSLRSSAEVREMIGGPHVAQRMTVLSIQDLDMMALFAHPTIPEMSSRDSVAMLLDDEEMRR